MKRIEEIFNHIKENGPIEQAEVVKHFDELVETQVSSILLKLEKRKLIKKTKDKFDTRKWIIELV